MRGDDVDFVRRLLKRRPDIEPDVRQRLGGAAETVTAGMVGAFARSAESAAAPAASAAPARLDLATRVVLETIVSEQRPVFFAAERGGGPAIDFAEADSSLRGAEAKFLAEQLAANENVVAPVMARVGRIDVEGITGAAFVGTGWVIDDGIVATNRHVAELIAKRSGDGFAFRMGSFGRPLLAAFATGHLATDDAPGLAVPIASVIYVEPDGSDVDIAFVSLAAHPGVGTLAALPIRSGSVGEVDPLVTLGYPAKASRRLIPDQALMDDLYRGRYDVKRVAPGYLSRQEAGLLAHDCTTLGGNSGSAVVVMGTGEVAGLHFAGVYLRENQAVPASILLDYRSRRRWLLPPSVETTRPAAAAPAPRADQVTITITVPVGAAVAGVAVSQQGQGAGTGQSVEAAAAAFFRAAPAAVIAARVGYGDDDDAPFIAASVPQSRFDQASGWPTAFAGVPVRYEAATLEEQLSARAAEEAAFAPAYDDDARTGPAFALEPRQEEMTVRAHVSPEYGFDELTRFLADARGSLTSAIYEFEGLEIAKAVEGALVAGVHMQLAVDKKGAQTDSDETDPLTIAAATQFERWHEEHAFAWQAVPIGRRGLVGNAYHIKVSVRSDDTVWLSSGNWKNESSQPVVDDAMRARALDDDLPGNREWHIIAKSPFLAERFRSHIAQDVVRSAELAAQEAAVPEPMVLVPASVEAPPPRQPPSRLAPTLVVSGRVSVHPILTPDRDGRIYTDAVLELIGSARRSLVFQIPYIGTRRVPDVDRGNIDELIDALVDKLLTLPDARVLLRTGNREFSDNRHVAWFLKSKGVDTAKRVKEITDSHTKGMVVDGARVLVGSHNWSDMGTSINRDASLIFDDRRIAGYFGDVFEIDWARARRVSPREFVRRMPELAGFGEAPVAPPGYRLMSLSEAVGEADS